VLVCVLAIISSAFGKILLYLPVVLLAKFLLSSLLVKAIPDCTGLKFLSTQCEINLWCSWRFRPGLSSLCSKSSSSPDLRASCKIASETSCSNVSQFLVVPTVSATHCCTAHNGLGNCFAGGFFGQLSHFVPSKWEHHQKKPTLWLHHDCCDESWWSKNHCNWLVMILVAKEWLEIFPNWRIKQCEIPKKNTLKGWSYFHTKN